MNKSADLVVAMPAGEEPEVDSHHRRSGRQRVLLLCELWGRLGVRDRGRYSRSSTA